MKSLGYITDISKMTRFGYVEHGLKYITLYVQKDMAYLAALVRDGPLGAY